MKLLIAGATGAIGKPLLNYLNDAGHELFALVRSPKAAGIANPHCDSTFTVERTPTMLLTLGPLPDPHVSTGIDAHGI